MRKPTDIECLYIDFDAFFAHVEKQVDPACRDYAVGVTSLPSEKATLITCCYIAKAAGVKRGMRVFEARELCPDIIIKPARHDLYVKTHNAILDTIGQFVPVTKAWSIDEMECTLIGRERTGARDLAKRVKTAILDEIGKCVTPSVGLAPNQFLAKVAAEMNKPNGLTLLHPDDLPGPLLKLKLRDLPGISSNMETRLNRSGIVDMKGFWDISSKHARKIWGNVEGERMWAQFHGYSVSRPATKRRMFGHSRMLSREWTKLDKAYEVLRLLTVKAAYRMRREGYTAGSMAISLRGRDNNKWGRDISFSPCADDFRLLEHMTRLFNQIRLHIPIDYYCRGVYVMLHDIVETGSRSGDLFDEQPANPRKLAAIRTMDALNEKHGAAIIHVGPRPELPGGYAGAKIAFGRVPDAKDFF